MTADERDLEGLSALVTGATSGIGQAAARQLARHGAEVIVHGRDAGRAGPWSTPSRPRAGRPASPRPTSAIPPAGVDDLLQQAGLVDVLVNNAGVSWFGPTPDIDVATFARLFVANVQAPYFLTAALIPQMAARGSGVIINVGSMAGEVGMPGRGRLRRHEGRAGLDDPLLGRRVQPGRRSHQHRGFGSGVHAIQPAEVTQGVGDTTIMKRAAQPDEIANVIVFLASPKASYITGAVIAADGGRSAI